MLLFCEKVFLHSGHSVLFLPRCLSRLLFDSNFLSHPTLPHPPGQAKVFGHRRHFFRRFAGGSTAVTEELYIYIYTIHDSMNKIEASSFSRGTRLMMNDKIYRATKRGGLSCLYFFSRQAQVLCLYHATWRQGWERDPGPFVVVSMHP